MNPIEAEKQRQYNWWLDVFLPVNVRPGNRDERYRIGILVTAMLGILVSALLFAIQSWALAIDWRGKLSMILMFFVPVAVLLHVRWTGRYRRSAWYFGLLATPLVVIHILSLKTIYVGFFYWIPWIIIFVSFLAGRRHGLFMAALVVLSMTAVLQGNRIYGHSFGAYGSFSTLFFHLLQNQTLSALAIAAMMFTLALYNDRMEGELESQHVLRAQTAHKSMIGEMLGNLAHEVNNPLAIVHTALVHYQRLLQTHRLEKFMERGLMERMGDALDRLRHVLDDLNSTADWGELEMPRSFASLQSEHDRPLQFGSSRLMNSSPGKRLGKHRRHLWFYRWMRVFIKGLDLTLPRVTRNWSTTQRFQARATALICTVGLVATTSYLVQESLSETVNETILMVIYLFCGIAFLAMAALKIVPKPQVIGVGYIILQFLMTAALAIISGRSSVMQALHWFPLLIASLFLVSKPRIALIASLLLIFVNIVLMNHLQIYELQIAFTQTFDQYVQRLQATLILTSLTILVLSGAFMTLMDSTYGQLVAEKDWHLLSARLREVNELADSVAILIGEPLKQLKLMLQELKADGQNVLVLESMQAAVHRINHVSQSFALLSRPELNEDIQTIDGAIWIEHIQNICLRRAAGNGWILTAQVEPQNALIEGPLGRLTMLVITSLKQAFAHPAPQPLSRLQLRVILTPDVTQFRIQYQAFPQSDTPKNQQQELEEAMRLSLQQELMAFLHASLERRQEQNEIIQELQWHHADFRKGQLP